MTEYDPNEEVIIPRTRDAKGRRINVATLTPREDQRCKVLLTKIPATIPVIFLPGIMGTNLKHKKTGEPVWRPPNASLNVADILGIVGALMTWGRRDAKKRQDVLKAEDLAVDDRGPIDVGDSGVAPELARERGWGSVHRDAYAQIMALLEQRTERMVVRRELQEGWKDEALRSPLEYGEERGQPALTGAEITRAARYDFDVWCCGYNWLQSNRQSGQDLIAYLRDEVMPYYLLEGIPAEQVILVTHSMGGFVARAATEIHGDDKILGVVSGVQPATGAPAIYHHMRCGYEGMSQLILGRNAGEVTAVVANAPGALELCPTFDHRGGQGWLFLRDALGLPLKDAQGRPRRYPASGDPYAEIYTNPAWYGLVPEQNSKYLDLSRKPSDDSDSTVDPRGKFCKLIDQVTKFHRDISGKYHPETYAHYGADDADDEMHSWRDVVWRGDAGLLEAPGITPKDDGNGSYRSWIGGMRHAPEIIKVKGAGDGTVAVDSGAAPGQAGVKASFRHGSLGKGQYNAPHKGYGHQPSYKDEYGRAQWATLYGIVKIAQLANWHPNDEGCE